VPALKQIAGRDQIDRGLIRLAGFQQITATRRVAIARPDNALAEIRRIAVGGNVDQLRGEISIGAELVAKRISWTGPVTSISSSSGGVK